MSAEHATVEFCHESSNRMGNMMAEIMGPKDLNLAIIGRRLKTLGGWRSVHRMRETGAGPRSRR